MQSIASQISFLPIPEAAFGIIRFVYNLLGTSCFRTSAIDLTLMLAAAVPSTYEYF